MLDLGYISVPAAEERSGIARSTIYDAISKGTLTTNPVGKRHYLAIEPFLEWIGPGGRELWELASAEA